ncbi:ATP-dependent permease MDL1 [Entamoeba marina]
MLFEYDDIHVFSVSPDPNELEKKKTKQGESGSVSLIKLFKYANVIDFILLGISIVASTTVGALMPMMMLVFGDMMDVFRIDSGSSTSDISLEEQYLNNQYLADDCLETLGKLSLKMLYFGIGSMIAGCLTTFCSFVLSQRQGIKIRNLYFQSLLRQDMGWYDLYESGELTSHIASDVQNIQDGMGYKFGLLFQTIATLISGYVLGFTLSWDLTLVILCCTPFLFLALFFVGFTSTIFFKKKPKCQKKLLEI